MKHTTIIRFLKGLLTAYILSALVILVLALILFKWDAAESVIRGGIIFTYVISSFACGMVVSKQQSGRRYLWGILAGGMYYVVLVVVSMICSRAVFTGITGIVPVLFFCLAGGMLGGMMQAGRQ
jgi:putative membrane protein (TIGR04086 family)